jgi:tetrahydromethanopterin S-methyltransferase subunit A
LTSTELFAPLASLPGVAIAGRVYSANLGLEKLIANVTANRFIRFLLVCGRESPYFQVGQALDALFANGVTPEGRIVQAAGHMPELSPVAVACSDHFRKQVELVRCIGETNMEKLAATVQKLAAQNPGPYRAAPLEIEAGFSDGNKGNGFRPIRLGGHRQSLAYDPMGFFIITLDRDRDEILVHHYWSDHSPAHLVQGRNAEAILLALLREELISQRGHAGYLGAELAKAETALRLGLLYEQDRPLQLIRETASRHR